LRLIFNHRHYCYSIACKSFDPTDFKSVEERYSCGSLAVKLLDGVGYFTVEGTL
jgi:hypothetical protein